MAAHELPADGLADGRGHVLEVRNEELERVAEVVDVGDQAPVPPVELREVLDLVNDYRLFTDEGVAVV